MVFLDHPTIKFSLAENLQEQLLCTSVDKLHMYTVYILLRGQVDSILEHENKFICTKLIP